MTGERSLLERYCAAIAIAAVALLYSNVVLYLFVAKLSPLPPLPFVLGLLMLTLPLVLVPECWRAIMSSRLVAWCGLYLALTAIFFFRADAVEAAVQEVRNRALAILFFIALVPVMSVPIARFRARQAIVATTLISIAVNVYELFHPLTFSAVLGRSAGLYINPNISGAAILLGLILGIGILPERFRATFLVAGGLGILLTLSRAAVLGWLLLCGALLVTAQVRLRRMVRTVIIMAAFGAAVLIPTGRWNALVAAADITGYKLSLWQRITDADQVINAGDKSTMLRAQVARAAWSMFEERPLGGFGVGATSNWEFVESTHNLFLRHLAEYGVLGLMLIPLLAFAIVNASDPATRRLQLAVAACLLFWSLFSHNVLDEAYFLISIALAACAGSFRTNAVGASSAEVAR